MRVAIVGAGAAGLSLAHYLWDRRRIRAEVFEASERVGGKCTTSSHDGIAYDLGAVLVGAGYHHVRELVSHYEVELLPGPRHVFVERDGRRLPFDIRAGAMGDGGSLGATLEQTIALARLGRVLYRERSLAQAGFDSLGADLELPIAEYLRRHGLEAAAPFVLPLFTGYGYGFADTVPMAYLLKLLYLIFPQSFSSARSWSKRKRETQAKPIEWFDGFLLGGGYQGLWERIAARMSVRREEPVTRVTREGESSVMIETAGGTRSTFDRVVFTIHPRAIAAILDCDDEERALFAKIKDVSYRSLLCALDPSGGAKQRGALFLRQRHERSTTEGRLLVLSRASDDRKCAVAYVLCATHDDEIDRAQLVEDVARCGERLEDVICEQRWTYFPHLGTNDFRSFYEAAERRQGRRGTFLAGEVMSFSSVEHVCQYSSSLVERCF